MNRSRWNRWSLLLFPVGLLMVQSGLFEADAPKAQGHSTAIETESDEILTARRNNYVREGPGSFHEVVVAVKKDFPLPVLNRKEGWIRVRLPDDRTGWIAETSVRRGTSSQQVATEEVAEEWAATEVTKSGVAAAVRGFQMRTEGPEERDVETLLRYIKSTPSISENDLEHYQRPVEAGTDSRLRLEDLKVDLSPFDPTLEEKQVGFAVASRLGTKGLVQAPRVQRYLTLMSEQLTEGTPYYDVDFDIVLVEGDGPDAYACPGGILFLTRGVFVHFENEAQVAGLLAHEIAHVVRRHGMAERDEREVQRKADDAFAELEDATEGEEDKYAGVEEDLETMMRESYERVVNDRLLEYEIEADRIAAALLAEAGYSPMGIVNAVERIAVLRANDPDLFDEEYLEVKNLEKRFREVRSFVEAHGGDEGGQHLPRRFRAYDDELR